MIRVSICQRNKSRGILTWYARIFDTETKEIRYESLGTTKKTEANELMLAKHAAGEFAVNRKNLMTVGRAFELYLADCETRGSNQQSLNTIRHSLDSVRSLYDRPIAKVTKMELMEAFSEAAAGFKPTTYNNTKTTVRTAFKFARDTLEAIEANPADCLKSRRNYSKERDFWTVEQVEMILDRTENPMHRLLFAVMAFAGLRIHEALKLKRGDLRDGFISVVGKGSKFAKIPISSRMAQEFGRVNWEFDFTGVSQWTLNDCLRRTARRALGDTFSGSANPHRLRHSFASALIRANVGPKSVQKLLRHANISTTLNIYSHLLEEDLVKDIEKMFKTS